MSGLTKFFENHPILSVTTSRLIQGIEKVWGRNT